MEKEAPSSLFVNDGSFMERFKQLQQENAKDTSTPSGDPKQSSIVSRSGNPSATKTHLDSKANNSEKSSQPLSGGKLAFSLKQKSRLVAPPVKLAADEDEDDADARSNLGDMSVKRQKLIKEEAYEESSGHGDVGKYHFMNIILCGQGCDGRLLFGLSFLSRSGTA
ncbi:AAI domain-containing protein [Psidium guajava]|nr:AAI domain-containing protein [Psidium guajava]